MAETKTTGPAEYGASTYSNGWLVDKFDAGMHNNAQYIDALAELNGLTGDAYARVAAMSDPDASYEELSAQFAAENEDWKSGAYKDLTKNCRINAALNGTAFAMSAASAAVSIGGAISYTRAGMGVAGDDARRAIIEFEKANKLGGDARLVNASTKLEAANAAKAAAKSELWSSRLIAKAGQEGTSTLAKVGLKTAGYSLMAGEKLFGAARFVSGAGRGKTNLFRLGLATAVEVAPTALPVLAAHVYTSGRTEAVKDEYVAAINTQQGVYDYLCNSGDELSEDIKKDYSGWQESYEATQAQLLEDFNAGKITKAEYDKAYGEFLESSQQQLDELTASHKEAGQYILGKGSAAAMGEQIVQRGYDTDQVSQATPYLQKLAEENPEQMEATKAAAEAAKATSSGNAFVDFLANMNAALVHYIPAVAYVEAAVIKGVDTVLDFAGDKLPIFNYSAKHEGESISDIASAISQTAEARYEAKQAADAMADGVADGKDWQAATGEQQEEQEQQAASGSLAYT